MKKWNITKTQYKISDFISWQRSKGLDLSPSFQRRSVWKLKAKSYLIDTIIRGLPVPVIFLRERQTNTETLEPSREVIDGQQRLRAVIAYIKPELLEDRDPIRDTIVLSKTHTPELAGKRFAELDEKTRQAILDYEFSVHTLPSDVPDREVLHIFARMNATGVKLNDQELRNAEFFGELKTSVYDRAFAYLDTWRKLNIFTEDQIARMQEVEFCSELYLMLLQGIKAKSKAGIEKIYSDYDDKFRERKELEKRFNYIMEMIQDRFGNRVKTTIFRNKQVLLILFVVLNKLLYGNANLTVSHAPNKLTKPRLQVIETKIMKLDAGKVNKSVSDALDTRRISGQKERQTLVEYLAGV